MKSNIRRSIKSVVRLYTIIKTLLLYGIDEWLPKKYVPWWLASLRALFFWLQNQHPQQDIGVRLSLALQSLGPVFIKFGQMLSTRRDLLPAEVADALAKLQDQVAPFSPEQALVIVKESLQLSALDEVFSEFADTPLASASIAQVHAARLRGSEQDVVVKVLRPGIKQIIEADISLLVLLATLVQKWLADGQRLRPVEVVKEYERTIIDELDLQREAANGIRLKQNFNNSPALYVPEIYIDYCRTNVLVMERIRGIPVSNIRALMQQGTNMKLLAERGVEVFFTQVFRDSFFHADMHPGNIFVSQQHPEDPQYIAIDFGIVGTLNGEDKRYLAENFVAFFNRDYRKVAQLHADSGWVPRTTNIDEFEMAIRAVCEPIFQKPLAEISFGQVLLQLFNTARRFDMVVQPQLVLLQKTLLYIEGLGRQLYPQLDLWQTAKPFLENWMKEQMGFAAFVRKVSQHAPYWSEKLPEMPELLYVTLQQMKRLPAQHAIEHADKLAAIAKQERALRLAILGVGLSMTSLLVTLLSSPSTSTSLLGVVGLLLYWKSGRLNKKSVSY